MSITTYRLQTAAFPEDYADILIELLGLAPANLLSVKDALYHFHGLDDDQAVEAMRQIAARIEITEEESDGRVAPPEQQEANGRLIVAAPALLAACWMVIQRWERGDLGEAARACQAAVELATGNSPPWDITEANPDENKPYSVLLLYPDYANDSGTETFYAFVAAADPVEAVGLAQWQAAEAQDGTDIDPGDFAPLLVTPGHARSEPLFNR